MTLVAQALVFAVVATILTELISSAVRRRASNEVLTRSDNEMETEPLVRRAKTFAAFGTMSRFRLERLACADALDSACSSSQADPLVAHLDRQHGLSVAIEGILDSSGRFAQGRTLDDEGFREFRKQWLCLYREHKLNQARIAIQSSKPEDVEFGMREIYGIGGHREAAELERLMEAGLLGKAQREMARTVVKEVRTRAVAS